jgi:hypothetical protein
LPSESAPLVRVVVVLDRRGGSVVGSRLDGRHRDPVFMSQPSPTVLLSPDFVIRAATPSYLTATGRHEEELVRVNVFDAFPENPATPELQPAKDLTDSLERVLRTRRPHHLSPLRYDIPDVSRPGEFLEKRWVLANTPVYDGDDVVGVMVRVEDVTLVDENLFEALRIYRDVLAGGDLRTADARQRVDAVGSFLAIVEGYTKLGAEVTQLRQALRTRPTIEQAKGIVMADRRCTPDEAFAVLKKLSMDTNVPLADVAAAIVYQVGNR